jgi:glycine/D-amino acid oxidase-like deaminating enzyme
MTPTTVVVGGGVIGAAIAQQLARRGAGEVVLCEQGQGAGAAATVQSGGLLRQHHTADCDIELAVRGLPTFQRFGELVGGYCGYQPSGFALLVGEAEVEALRLNVDKVKAAGGRTDLLEPDQLAARYPGLRLDGVAAVAYEPDGGYGNPLGMTRNLLLAARSDGARVLDGVLVERLVVRGERVVGVRTNVGEIACTTVVLAAGTWSTALADAVGVELPVSPRWIGLGMSRSATKSGYRVPACIDDTSGNYFRPNGAPGMYFGVSWEPEVPPRSAFPALRSDRIEESRDARLHRVPARAEGRLAGTRLGVDGYTPDKRPLIGPIGPEGLYVATGMSGGGFKLAPAIGELVAHEIHTAGEHKSLMPYRPQRFAAQEPIVPEFSYQWM